RPGADAPAPARAGAGRTLLRARRDPRAGRAARPRAGSRLRAPVVRQGGGAQGPRPRTGVRTAPARVRRARRRLDPGGLRPGARRAGGLDRARVHADARVPGEPGLATGATAPVGAAEAASLSLVPSPFSGETQRLAASAAPTMRR